ncbi:hypothetical protein [Caulobacter sp. 17J80-11]|uniref:hypothetical protein n=1 Tax=Caulobacter sp. 17J80-11 TaxID=2763502 RepID=UPI001653C1E2|nr:hypothetical protein [Caulobacter sp. 17J80-11]MBC6980405.1 hypothetical protein [Caulobacter sp. 17J80-11]
MPTLFTVACEGLTPDALETLLGEAGVSTVADVRREPLSPLEWSEARLGERLEGAGVGYVRLAALAGDAGGPEADEAYTVLRGLALDEDVCLISAAAEPAAALAARLAAETGLPVTRLGAA